MLQSSGQSGSHFSSPEKTGGLSELKAHKNLLGSFGSITAEVGWRGLYIITVVSRKAILKIPATEGNVKLTHVVGGVGSWPQDE